MVRINVGTKRQRRMLEWVIVSPLALASLGFIVWDAKMQPTPPADWTVVPMHDDIVKCPAEYPTPLRIDYDREVLTCGSEGR